MTRLQYSHGFLAALILMVGMLAPANGSTVFWGTFSGDVLLNSEGNDLDATFIWEIGAFDPSFTPTSSNLDQWSANWKVFDAATAADGWIFASHFVNTSVNHTVTSGSDSPDANPGDTFPQFTAAYLWVYNSKDLNVSPEWALVSDVNKGTNVFSGAWEFPDPSLQGGESFDWQTRDLDTPIVGGVNNVQGAGSYAVNPVGFSIQTHVVPEPGSALLIAVAGAACLRRRRFCRSKSLSELK